MRNNMRHDRRAADIELMASVGVGEEDSAWAREAIGELLDHATVTVSRARVTLTMLAGRAVAQPALISIQIEFNSHTFETYAVAPTIREAVRRACDELREMLANESAGKSH